MSRRKSINALLKHCDDAMTNIRSDYESSLSQKKVSEELKINIKNFCENLRSVLDYLAHDIVETCCPNAKPKDRLYFPMTDNSVSFGKMMVRSYPDLDTNNKDLYNYLESIQPFQSEDKKWLGHFNKINNENKHQNLIEQSKSETKRVTVSRQGGSVSWGSGVKFGAGVSVMGVPIDPKTQMPVPNDVAETKVITWVDFRFSEVNISALQLLQISLNGIKEINQQITKFLTS